MPLQLMPMGTNDQLSCPGANYYVDLTHNDVSETTPDTAETVLLDYPTPQGYTMQQMQCVGAETLENWTENRSGEGIVAADVMTLIVGDTGDDDLYLTSWNTVAIRGAAWPGTGTWNHIDNNLPHVNLPHFKLTPTPGEAMSRYASGRTRFYFRILGLR